jgi:glycosyltransferase involved in cell wall biosynthesis
VFKKGVLEPSAKISEDLSSKILTTGTDYHNHRGGIGAVIEVYSRYFEVFNFIATHKNGSIVYKIYVFLFSLIKFIFTLISNRKIKTIHIHGSSYGSFYRKFVVFIIGRYIFRKKIVYHIHGGAFQKFYENSDILTKRLVKILLSNANIILCLSESWGKYYEQNFEIRRLKILPNIIDYHVKVKDAVKTDIINFLYLGLLCDAKGIFDLIEVIVKNKERYKGRIKLYIGGNGEVQRLEDMINKHHIEDIVEFLGWISSTDKAIALNSSDVYILPSYTEGLPISILESMSYGKAIISTNVGGIPEIVKNNENGLLINPGDLKQIEQSIDFFLENPEKVRKYGIISEQIVQKYLPHSVLKELEEIYKSIL